MAVLATTAIAVLAAACGKVKSPTEPPASAGGPAFTFARIQAEILSPTCAKSGCHSATTQQEGMVLAAGVSYAQIVGRRSLENPSLNRVQPGDPERSYLLKKVRGDGDVTGSRMPQDGPPFLSQAQIDGIAGWIQAGAPNN